MMKDDKTQGEWQAILKVLRRIDRTTFEIQVSTPSLEQVDRIVEAIDQLDFWELILGLQAIVDQQRQTNELLAEILKQSHNPLRALPPLPVGRGNHRGGGGELAQKPKQRRNLPHTPPGVRSLRQLQRRVKGD